MANGWRRHVSSSIDTSLLPVKRHWQAHDSTCTVRLTQSSLFFPMLLFCCLQLPTPRCAFGKVFTVGALHSSTAASHPIIHACSHYLLFCAVLYSFVRQSTNTTTQWPPHHPSCSNTDTTQASMTLPGRVTTATLSLPVMI